MRCRWRGTEACSDILRVWAGGGSRVSAMSRRGSGATAKLCWVEERTFAMVGVSEYEIQYEEGGVDDQSERGGT